MNLFDLQNNFWRLNEFENFSGNEVKLYFYLLHLANRSYWEEWFAYPDSKMTANLGFSTQVLRTAKLKLKETGLIDYKIGGGYRAKSKYQILTPILSHKLPQNINTKDKKIKDKDFKTKRYDENKQYNNSEGDFNQ